MSSYINKYRESDQEFVSAEGYWNVLKGALLEATDRSYGWIKGPAGHKQTW